MKTLPVTQIDDADADILFQKFLKSCDTPDDLISAKNYQSTVDRFNMKNIQFDKPKSKSKYKQRLSQREDGFIKAGQIQGNVGNRSLDDLLRFINGNGSVVDEKASLTVKQNIQQNNNKYLKTQSQKTDEEIQNALNHAISQVVSTDSAAGKSDVRVVGVEPTTGDVVGGSTVSEKTRSFGQESCVSTLVAGEPADAEEGLEKISQLDSDAEIISQNCEGSVSEVTVEHDALENGRVRPLEQEKDFQDAVDDSSMRSLSPKTEPAESSETNNFTVVLKKRRNRNLASPSIETGSKPQNWDKTKTGDNLSRFWGSKYPKSEFSSRARQFFKQPWSDVYRDKRRRGSEMMLKSSESEASSTCSVPVLSGISRNVVSNGRNLINRDLKNPEISELSKGYSSFVSKNGDVPLDKRVPVTCSVAVEACQVKNLNSDTETHSDNGDRTAEQVTKPVKTCVEISISNAVPEHPVVFLDTRKKSARASSPEEIGITFGFDPDIAVREFTDSSNTSDGTIAPVFSVNPILYPSNSQHAIGFFNGGCFPGVFEDSLTSSSSAISIPNQMYQTVVPHIPAPYGAFDSFSGAPYALPVSIPVGIVNPYIFCDYGQADLIPSDFITFEDASGTSSELANVLTQVIPPMQECPPEVFGSEVEVAPYRTFADDRVSKSSDRYVFDLSIAQDFLHSEYQDIISHCTLFDPNDE